MNACEAYNERTIRGARGLNSHVPKELARERPHGLTSDS